MPAVTSTLAGFSYEVQCSRHQDRVVGRVVEMGSSRYGKCLTSRNSDCALYWYVEVVYTEFEKPEVEDDTRPAS